MVDVTHEHINLGTRCGCTTERAVPICSIQDDGWNRCERFNIINKCWQATIPSSGWVWRACAWFTTFPFQGLDQGGLLPTDIRSCSKMHMNMERKIAPLNLITQPT